jgi:GH15 family glucan-1,4-alpha-glucosidase
MAGLIEDYALIGDMNTAALVGRDGSIDWLCLPRFDSGACFARLLGTEDNGHWQLAPTGAGPATRRRYEDDTLVLCSEWDSDGGRVRITDFMPHCDGAVNVVRIVEGLDGEVAMSSEVRLRFDYGRIVPWVRHVDGDVTAIAGPDAVWLHSEVPCHGRQNASRAEFTVRAGERVRFVLTWHPSHEPEPAPPDADSALRDTVAYWQEWAALTTYDGPYRAAVVRSLITLKALTYAPTGGITAAATTSLPEEIGGVRNWDYRFCWLRDATLTLQALLRSGHSHEAVEWREWLLRAIAGSPADLQIMYGLAGERRIREFELPWLAGYEGSTPVRVGNEAAEQLQLDVYGEVVDALYLARRAGIPPEPASWRIQRLLVEWLVDHWHEPDEGLWEVRGPRRQFVHSKVLAWVAFDRAVKTVEESDRPGDVERWRAARDEVHREVLAKGFDTDRNTFTQSYGSREIDAALLLIPQVGFLPPKDPRVVGTVEAVQRTLARDGLVHRYDSGVDGEVDGLPGREGAFLVCSFWLADALLLMGRVDEAREQFERLLALGNDLGLLAEEYDAAAGRQLGNWPQAFSHVGLVNTALNLDGIHLHGVVRQDS